MTVTAAVPVLAAVLGLLVYLLASNPKAAEAGRLMYAAGVLVALFQAAGQVLRLG